jgi:hypothetical protein
MCKIVQSSYNMMHYSGTIMQNCEMTVFLMEAHLKDATEIASQGKRVSLHAS